MPGLTPLQIALFKANNTTENIKLVLEQDVSSLNEMDDFGMRPLDRLLLTKGPECSTDIVKIMLDYGARVDLPNKYGQLPLQTAIESGTKADVIKILLNRGAGKIKICDRTSLCYALTFVQSNASVIKVFLDAGWNECVVRNHGSPLHCALRSMFPVKADVIQLLLNMVADVNRVDDYGCTFLYNALRTSSYDYDMRSMKLLLDQPEVEINGIHPYNYSLLHAAVSNPNSKFNIVKYLIDRGARVDAEDIDHDTPLHCAVMNLGCQPRIIKMLLKKGSPVNKTHPFYGTPLVMAIENNCNLDILKLLLDAGAEIIVTKYERGRPYCILQRSLNKYYFEGSEENLERFKALFKYSLIESPDLNIENLIQGHWDYDGLSHFATDCVTELQNMKSEEIGPNLTLREFVGRYSGIQMDAAEKKQDYDFGQLLKILGNNAFPVYFEVILAKVKRSIMVTKLEEQRIYAAKSHPDVTYDKGKIYLDYASVWNIVQFLPNNDLFNLMMAFPISDDHMARVHPKHTNLVSKMSPEKSPKRSLLGL